MGRDLTIRPVGRPKISKDSQLGFQTIARKYVVQGPRVAQVCLNEATNPLFLATGTADEEYTDHLLTNQAIEPANSPDRAYMTRTFVNLRNRWVSESISETVDLVKLSRQFVVLRGQVSIYGYSTAAWAKHPSNTAVALGAKDTDEEPWDYAPYPVLNGEPGGLSYTDANAASHGMQNNPWVSIGGSSQTLSAYLTAKASLGNLGAWVRGNVTVTMAAPGVDVWNCTWVTHAKPYWTFGTTGRGSGKSQVFTMVDFDHLGLKLTQVGSGGTSSTTPMQAKTYNTFYVGDSLPTHLAQLAGGSISGSSSSSSVSLDFHITLDGGRTVTNKQFIKNAVWTLNTTENLSFPTLAGGTTVVGEKDPYILKFDKGPFMWSSGGYTTVAATGLPMYQGTPVAHIGGQITWTGTQMILNSAGAKVLSSVSSKITPLFRRDDTKIWKVQITYVG